MRSTGTLALLAVVVSSSVGCRGKMVATAVLSGPGTADVQFESTGKPLVLWADTEGSWIGDKRSRFPALYEIDVLSNGAKIGHVTCDTSTSTMRVCGTRVSVNNSRQGDCELKLTCRLPPIPAGSASLHVTGSSGPGASNIKNMSINVREE